MNSKKTTKTLHSTSHTMFTASVVLCIEQ